MSFIEQIIKLLLDLIIGVLTFLFELIEALVTGFPKGNKEYKAEFASQSTLLSSWNKGFCLTGRSNLTVKQSYQNALVIGGTGTGKSSVVLTPSTFSMFSSFIVHDPSGENYLNSAAYKLSQGYEIKRLNFANPEISCGYNPLARANTSSQIQKIASMLIEASLGGKSKDPFWNSSGTAVLAMMIAIVKKQEPQFQNLYNVLQLLNLLKSNPEAVDTLFSKYADGVLFNEYNAFVAQDEKICSGIIATCKAALQIFADESVARVTSYDTLDFQDFRDKLVILYIQNSVSDQRYYSVLTSLLFEQFFSFLLGRFPKKDEQDIFLLIDEASSLFLPTLPLAIANCRKHRAGIMILLQSYNQLVNQYGKHNAEAIRSNCFAQMYFTGQTLETATELEQTLGKFEFKDEKGGKVIMPLMTKDAIRMMKSNRALLICGNNPPIMARLKPYYKRLQFKRYSQLPAPEIGSDYYIDTIPVLSLPILTDQTDA